MISHNNKNSTFWYTSLLLAVFITFPVVWEKIVSNKIKLNPVALTTPVDFKSGWVSSTDQSQIIISNFHGSSSGINNIYIKDSMQVGFLVKYYNNQDYDNKLVSSNNSIFAANDKYWIKLDSNSQTVNVSTNSFTALTSEWKGLRAPQRSAEIYMQTWQFYWVNGSFTSSDYKAKIYGAIQRLLGKGYDAAIIVLYASDTNGVMAHQSINKFLEDNYLQIKILLEKNRSF